MGSPAHLIHASLEYLYMHISNSSELLYDSNIFGKMVTSLSGAC